ncbi:MAG: type VI secretion system baseplate subunit TssG [Acidobacteriota bacterium]
MIPSQIPLIDRLLESGHAFDFFQAVRLLGVAEPGSPGLGAGEHPSEEFVRFEAQQSLQFPPSSIAWISKEQNPPRMTVTFFGLTGIQGVLPLYITEHIILRAAAHDFAMARFFDLFNHRLLSLFYRAWQKYNFPARFQLAEARQQPCEITHYLLDLIGLGTKGLGDRFEPLQDVALLRYTGLLAQAPRSAVALEQTLRDFFGLPVAVEQMVGSWHIIQEDDQCDLGGEGIRNQLGEGAVAGDAVWDPQAGIRIHIGPLPLLRFLSFLPGGDATGPLRDITRLYAGIVPIIEWNPILNAQEVPWCRLGDATAIGPRLGWTAWLKAGEFSHPAQEAQFEVVA